MKANPDKAAENLDGEMDGYWSRKDEEPVAEKAEGGEAEGSKASEEGEGTAAAAAPAAAASDATAAPAANGSA